MVAFAGGVLFAAVALVLTPPGIAAFSISVIAVLFVGGAACFALLTVVIERAGGKYGQVLALLSDFAPEAVALGAVFMSNPQQGALLAFFVGLQNFPEGYSAYCELRGGKSDGGKKALVILFALAFIGPIAALSGWHLLSMRSDIVAAMMLFAGGGIVYLTFQDIAPQALRKGAHWPALGAAAGFFLGNRRNEINSLIAPRRAAISNQQSAISQLAIGNHSYWRTKRSRSASNSSIFARNSGSDLIFPSFTILSTNSTSRSCIN